MMLVYFAHGACTRHDPVILSMMKQILIVVKETRKQEYLLWNNHL
jgi:hypothetical protein